MKKGSLYFRDVEADIIDLGIDRDDAKGQIRIDVSRRTMEMNVITPYLKYLIENDLSFVSPTLEMELVRALKKSQKKKDEDDEK